MRVIRWLSFRLADLARVERPNLMGGGWISVIERLPRCGDFELSPKVLVATEEGNWYSAYLKKDFQRASWLHPCGKDVEGRVTHWRYCPRVPEVE